MLNFKKLLPIFVVSLLLIQLQGFGNSTYASQNSLDQSNIERVIIITVDGLRYDFLDDTSFTDLGYFDWIIENGIRAESLLIPNPTLTATGHVSISAGANSSVHGLMGNSFYDWEDNATYSLFSDATDPYRVVVDDASILMSPQGYHWVEMNGGKSGVQAWPYSGSTYEGVAPTSYIPFDQVSSGPDQQKALNLLSMIDDEPGTELIYSWFRGVDNAGHNFPLFADEMVGAFELTNAAFGLLLEGLADRDLLQTTTIMIMGDHGLEPVTNSEFFIEQTTEYQNAVTTTGHNPIIAQDAHFAYLYFPNTNDPQVAHDFANILETNSDVAITYVNEEHEPLGMFNNDRGMNISVWYEPGVSRNFGSLFENMHGTINTNFNMRADFLMVGAGVDTTATPGDLKAIDVTPTALEMLGYPMLPEAQGSVMTDLINTDLGPDGSNLPVDETSTSSTTPTDTEESSDEEDSSLPLFLSLLALTIATTYRRRN